MELEYCFKCDEPTGCAGRADDSHYNEDGEGPFCWRCFCEDANPRLEEQIEQLQSQLDALRWIPVAEGLPTLEHQTESNKRIDDGTVDVLAMDEDGTVLVVNYFPKMNVWNGWNGWLGTIVKWMPIPALPEGGKG